MYFFFQIYFYFLLYACGEIGRHTQKQTVFCCDFFFIFVIVKKESIMHRFYGCYSQKLEDQNGCTQLIRGLINSTKSEGKKIILEMSDFLLPRLMELWNNGNFSELSTLQLVTIQKIVSWDDFNALRTFIHGILKISSLCRIYFIFFL